MDPQAPDASPEDTTDASASGADVGAAALAALREELDAVRERHRETEGRLRAVSKAFMDQKNEMAAFRERVEAQERIKLQRREFEVARIFFDPVQNLQRSLAAGIADEASFLEGVRLIHGQFVEGLHKLGLDSVPGVGSVFDPNLHEALALSPVDDPAQDGRVLMVHEEGFMVGGKALQPAKVVVGRYEAGASTPEA